MGSVAVGQFIEIITLFSIVIIHELGHYAAARIFGWRVTEVQILPFGGVAKVDESGNIPAIEEIIVAIAGPLQNGIMIVMAILFFQFGLWSSEWTSFFIDANLTIALFNLLPIVPLDGGRILQCLFSLWMKYRVAIDRSLQLSILLSVIMLIVSLGPGPLYLHLQLLCMSMFLIYANWIALKHANFQYMRFLLSRYQGKKRKNVKYPHPLIVSPSMKIVDMAMLLYREKYHVFYITEREDISPKVVAEEKLLYFYFQLKQPSSAIGQLLS